MAPHFSQGRSDTKLLTLGSIMAHSSCRGKVHLKDAVLLID